ncbi:TNF receptor-associated factor 6-like [Rhodnius prolixus]
MAKFENGRLNGCFKEKGDINRNYVLDSRFECPICLTCLKDPFLTTCGHRFCQECIQQWLKKEGGCCPIDGKSLTQEKDLFPDNYTRREIAQQTMECPFPGCDKILPLLETDSHILEIHEKADDREELEFYCTFKSIGCQEVFKSQSQLTQHSHRCLNQHLQLLTIAHNKLSKQIPLCNGENMEKDAAYWDPPPKQPANHMTMFDSSHALIKSLYERIVILEQRNTELELQLKNVKEHNVKMLEDRQKYEANLALRVCNGTYIWNLRDMRMKLAELQDDPSATYYSEGFYTSFSGYKFCARIHISTNYRYVSLLIHLMKGENDYALSWPFSGRIAFTLIHPNQPDLSVCEVMCSRPDLEAFKRPTKKMNTRGFGYSEFIQIEHITNMKFFNDDGSVNIKIQITCV